MPELPEVETTLRGLLPHVQNQLICEVIVRDPRLRYPVPDELPSRLVGRSIDRIDRRGKYLLFAVGDGHMMIHLGMSGSLGLVASRAAQGRHDHLELRFSSGKSLRYTDPRRFGLVTWLEGDPLDHPLLCSLGPEPLGEHFTAQDLFVRSRKRRVAIKSFIMNSRTVVGVGNIYANEALCQAGISPLTPAGKISLKRYERLVDSIKEVLAAAIDKGGTTLRDFVDSEGKPGYFAQSLLVYGRGGEPCSQCGRPLKEVRLNQRSTVYCVSCQR